MKPYADHFSRLAAGYAECRPGYPDELFAFLAHEVTQRELAWDCAAGSGQATLGLARWFSRVVATDASGAMLDQAPRNSRVEYRVAPAEASGLPDGAVDLVTVAQALHWLELTAFYEEVRRVLVPRGLIAVWTYGMQYLNTEKLDSLLDHFYREVVGPYWAPERRQVETGYRDLPFPFEEIETPSFRMQARWTASQLLGYIRTWSATQRFRETMGYDPVERLARELEPHWGDLRAARLVEWPLSLRVGRHPA